MTYRPRWTRDKDGLRQWDKLSSKVGSVVFKSGNICLQKWGKLSSKVGRVVFLKWVELYVGRVVLGRVVFGASCPDSMFKLLFFLWVCVCVGGGVSFKLLFLSYVLLSCFLLLYFLF